MRNGNGADEEREELISSCITGKRFKGNGAKRN